jgi:hypothetical protein
MYNVRFPTNPNDVPNESVPCTEGNIYDIVMQGYRRSLAEWLVICGITRQELESRLSTLPTLGIKQALTMHLRLSPMPTYFPDYKLLFHDKHSPQPTKLANKRLRVVRLAAIIAKFTSMPYENSHLCATWLLTDCYHCWLEGEAWHPDPLRYYPWQKVLDPTEEETASIKAIEYLVPHLLVASTTGGYFPSQRLIRQYKPALKKGICTRKWLWKLFRKVKMCLLKSH